MAIHHRSAFQAGYGRNGTHHPRIYQGKGLYAQKHENREGETPPTCSWWCLWLWKAFQEVQTIEEYLEAHPALRRRWVLIGWTTNAPRRNSQGLRKRDWETFVLICLGCSMLGCVKENVLNWSHPVLVYETPNYTIRRSTAGTRKREGHEIAVEALTARTRMR